MFLNTKGRDVTGAEPELIAFLRFVENSTAEEAHLSEDPRIQEMYRKINTLKNSEAVEADYMTAEEYKRRLQEEAEEFIGFIADQGADQCGFCNPGFVMNTIALLRENPDPTDDEIRAYLAGNLCRCSGYEGQLRGIRAFLNSRKDRGGH